MSNSLSDLEDPAASEAAPRRLRVLVADEQEVVRYGFRVMLGSRAWVARCLTCRSAEEAARLNWHYEPHVALLDSNVGEVSGFALCRALLADTPELRVILMSSGDPVPAEAAKRVGAFGTTSKLAPAVDLARAVAAVGRGETSFAREAPSEGHVLLSEREREVLQLIARGATNREIAGELHLSHHTVKEHTSVLYRKLRARNRAEAVRRGQRLGYHLDHWEPVPR